jgi:hypothetical protein
MYEEWSFYCSEYIFYKINKGLLCPPFVRCGFSYASSHFIHHRFLGSSFLVGLGSATATGTVAGGGGGTLEIVWSGIDDQPNTSDDATFTTNISTSEEFAVNGLPLGKFAVSARSRTGRGLVSSASLRVTGSGANYESSILKLNVRIVAALP